jgi:ribonuclease HII
MPVLKSFFDKTKIEAGCDEAGRGCLAGDVFAAAVILPHNFKHKLLNDSKQVNERNRYQLRQYIEENAIAYAVAQVSVKEIEKINILNAALLAMHRAVAKLAVQPQLLLIDGNRFKPYSGIPHQCIIKGDGKYKSIAAASILAKTYRDDYMQQLHLQYPNYGWNQNKAYGTQQHRDAILKHGTTPYHRMGFKLLPEQLSLPL